MDVEGALAFEDLPEPDPDPREARLERLRSVIRGLETDFIEDGYDYGYGGEVVEFKRIDEYALAAWVDGLLERFRGDLLEAVEAALG